MYCDIKHLPCMELHTLNSSVSKEIVYKNAKYFGPSAIGWLSKNIINAYILRIIEVSYTKSIRVTQKNRKLFDNLIKPRVMEEKYFIQSKWYLKTFILRNNGGIFIFKNYAH